MKFRIACAALLVAAPILLRPAAEEAIRGFDSASQSEEIKWEQQARAIPDSARIRQQIQKLSAQSHLAGTPQSKQTAEAILTQLQEYGLDAHIERFEAMLPTPKVRVLEMVEPTHIRMKLDEPPIAGDKGSGEAGDVPPFNAYSADGDVTGPLVYVNYGLPSDYDVLTESGIDVVGKIVIVRYGKSFRGIKPKVAAEHGAIACIIYSDPRDDGFFQGDPYPKGPYRPAEGVQRGSLLDLTLYPGDPLSPGWASEAGSRRLAISEAKTLAKIPVLPISWEDARPLLANLDGPVVPEVWRGGLPLTYHLGPGPAKVHMHVVMDNSTRPLYDVIARIPGSVAPDEWVLDGNHHDAWVRGASDPLSGAVPLMETARTLAAMTRKGWKPRRTIMLAFWDGEEYGLAGSTEWMEKHSDELTKNLAVYLNSDSSGRGRLTVGGSHTLEAFMQEVARDVDDPVSHRPLFNAADQRPANFRINALGSGSDYTPFLQHLGIATLDIRFASEDSGVYHSAYDDFNWLSHFGDPGFIYGRALAQVHTTALMRLADAPLLPFEFVRFTATIGRYLNDLDQYRRVDLNGVRRELLRLEQASTELDTAYARVGPQIASVAPAKLEALNQVLFRTERAMVPEPGLPGRPWYRHRIYAPGQYTGYDAKTLPGIREAVETNRIDEAREQADEVADVLRTLTGEVVQAQKMLAGF
jgi:N-acetylated-alpha-linked acidic dipeptidase